MPKRVIVRQYPNKSDVQDEARSRTRRRSEPVPGKLDFGHHEDEKKEFDELFKV